MSGATQGQDGNNQLQSMMYTMPLMMLFLFYRMPSGVTLYYLVSGALSLAQQYIIMKGRSDDGKEAVESMLKSMDSKALTPEGKIKTYKIDYNKVEKNPMGGIYIYF